MMNRLSTITLGIALSTGPVTISYAADQKVLKQCQAIQSEITRLESLRQDGGSAKQMDTWKRRIHDKQDQYSKFYCRKYRSQLDKD